MKRRLQSILIVSLLLGSTQVLGSTPNLYVLSLFTNESITNTATYGGRITLGAGNDDFSATATLRFQYPQSNITAHLTKKVHGDDSLLTGYLWGNLAYFSHAQDNGATSLTTAYALSASTPFSRWQTIVGASVGSRMTNSWSRNYDKKIWGIAPLISLSVSQTILDRLVIKLFVTTDTLCLPEGNLAYFYGISLALALTEGIIVQVRPLVRLSDYPNESVFVTLKEVSLSVIFTDASNRRHVMRELGVWL